MNLPWVIGTLVAIFNAWMATRRFRFQRVADRAVTFSLIVVIDIVYSTFAAGVLGILSSVGFMLCNLVGAFLILGVMWICGLLPRRTTPFRPNRGRISFRHLERPARWVIAILAVLLLLLAVIGVILPPFAYDELGYHLVAVAVWVQQHRIVDTTLSIWANAYPKNAELLYCWLYLATHSDLLVHLGQWIFAALGMVYTTACARRIGLGETGAVVAGTLFFLTPTVMLQSITDYNDVAFTSMFLAFFYFYLVSVREGFRLRYSFLAGLSGGMALGIKSSAAAYIGVCLAFAFIKMCRLWTKRTVSLRFVATQVTLVVVPLLGIGTYWYIHNWVVHHNPMYPFTVSVLGRVLFPGLGSVHDLIMVPNTPDALKGLPWWQQVFISWTSFPTYYAYDMQIGGLGLQWTWLELPCAVLVTGYALRRRRDLLMVILPLVIIFVLQPSNRWGRYTLFLAALGGWAVSMVIGWIRQQTLRTALYMATIVGICASYVLGIVAFARTNHRDSNLVMQALLTAIGTEPSQRTVGHVVFPEYRWVDSISSTASIGCTDDLPYVYPLFGRHAEHPVYLVTSADLVQTVQHHHIQYIMCKEGDDVDRLARQIPTFFHLLGDNHAYPVYQVRGVPDAHARSS